MISLGFHDRDLPPPIVQFMTRPAEWDDLVSNSADLESPGNFLGIPIRVVKKDLLPPGCLAIVGDPRLPGGGAYIIDSTHPSHAERTTPDAP